MPLFPISEMGTLPAPISWDWEMSKWENKCMNSDCQMSGAKY